MEDDAPVIYGLEFQARALTAQTAETDAIRFLVGTQSLKFDNQIHIIDFDDENNIINKNVLLHQAGEIWHIGASPADKAVLTTCYNKSESYCFLLSLAPLSASLFIMFLFFSFCLSFFVSFLHILCPFLFLRTIFLPSNDLILTTSLVETCN
uniref:EIPR1-like beta-propeller domain-containing protein n=1 Tax=Lates calcarifer TaxID=8187 RepID=A0A4W6G6M8_LATCA